MLGLDFFEGFIFSSSHPIRGGLASYTVVPPKFNQLDNKKSSKNMRNILQRII